MQEEPNLEDDLSIRMWMNQEHDFNRPVYPNHILL